MLATHSKEMFLLDKAAHDFSRKMLFPQRETNDTYPFGPFFQPALDQAFDLDFFHTTIPEDLGGLGHGISALCVLLENICTEDSSLGGIIFTHSAAVSLMMAAKARTELAAIASEKTLTALPVFINPLDQDTLPRAVKSHDDFQLTGTLDYLVLGGLAKQALIPARTGDSPAYSWFLVNLSQASVKASEPILSLGLRACPAADMGFDRAAARLIGDENQGDALFTAMADRMHTAAAAMSLGIMKGSFKEAMAYAKKREQGGRKIIDWSEMQMILGTMAVQIKVADLIVSRTSTAVDQGEKDWPQCSRAAAIHVQSLACELATDGVQAMGGVGYMKDFGQEKRFRDAKQLQALLGMAPLKKIRFLQNLM